MFKEFYWRTGSFVLATHLAFAIIVPWYLLTNTPSLALILSSIIIFILTALSVTLGYHRYYAHKAFELNPVVEKMVLFIGTVAVASSVLKWALDHRYHHTYVDTEKDPYNIKQGFWYAHMGWLFKQPFEKDETVIADLKKKKDLVFQDKYYAASMLVANAVVIIPLGLAIGDMFGAFALAFLARMIATHHVMWFVNSWAHTWGKRPYSTEHTAVNNWLLAIVTMGEGYHNFHHTFATDYRNGVRWYQIDPTKMTIWALSKIGLAKRLKRTSEFAIRRAQLMQDKRVLLKKSREIRWQEMEAEVTRRYEAMIVRLKAMQEQMHKLRQMRRIRTRKELIRDARARLKEIRKELKKDYKRWDRLYADVHRIKGGLAA